MVILANVKYANSARLSKEEKHMIDTLTHTDQRRIFDEFLAQLTEAVYAKIIEQVESDTQANFSIFIEHSIHPILEKKLISSGNQREVFTSMYSKSIAEVKKNSNIFGVLKISQSKRHGSIVSSLGQCFKYKLSELNLQDEQNEDSKKKIKDIISKFCKYHYKKYMGSKDKNSMLSRDCKGCMDKKRILRLDEVVKVLPERKFAKWMSPQTREKNDTTQECESTLKFEIMNKRFKSSRCQRVCHFEGLIQAEVCVVEDEATTKKLFSSKNLPVASPQPAVAVSTKRFS